MNTTSKGSAWVLKVRRLLESRGLHVTRRQWRDAGDDLQVMSHRLSIECKDWSSYAFGTWVDQAVKQSPGHLIPIVWAHRKGRASAEDGFVVMRGHDFLELLRGSK